MRLRWRSRQLSRVREGRAAANRGGAAIAAEGPSPKGRRKPATGFTEEERAAIREYAREARGRTRPGKVDGTAEVLAKIAAMAPADRVLAERIHELVTTTAPDLAPRLWYGMPAYSRAGKVVCFFQDAAKFKTRYATLGFSDSARLDEGSLWPTSYAVVKLTQAEEAHIVELVKRAAS